MQQVAGPIFSLAIYFAAPIAILFIIIGAYYYLTSAGEKDRAEKGKKIITHTLIAGVILLASMSFLQELLELVTQESKR